MQSCTPDWLKTLGVHVLIYLGCSKLIQTLRFYPQEAYNRWEALGESFIGLLPLLSSKSELGFLGFLTSRAVLMASSASQVHHANY